MNGGSGTVVNKPTLTGSPSTTSVSIIAPPGNDEFTFTAWDQLGGVGNILDQVSTSQNILADANNTVSASLDGICAALVPAPIAASAFVVEQSTSVGLVSGSRSVLKSADLLGPTARVFSFTRVDADGNTILTSAGVSPLAVSEAGTTPHVTIAPYGSSGTTAFSLTPVVGEPDGFSTTITATAPDCGTGTATFPNSFQLTTTPEIVVADAYDGIYAYDQDGNELAHLSPTQNFSGLAYSSKSGDLVAIKPNSTGTGGSIAFTTLTPTGTVVASSTFTPQNTGSDTEAPSQNPGQLAYDPANGNFCLTLQNGNTGVHGAIEEYSINGSTATYVASNSDETDPIDLTVLSNGNLVVNDPILGLTSEYSDALVYQYTSGINTISLSFDSTRGNVLGLTPPASGQYYPGGAIFDKYLDDAGTFTTPVGGDVYVSAYNPANDELYIFSDINEGGLSGTVIYAGGSSTSNIPIGQFPGLAYPNEAVVLP